MAERKTKQKRSIKPEKPETRPIVQDANFKQIYSNTLRAGHTQFDVIVTFGHILLEAGAPTKNVDMVAVILSPQHAKVFSTLFAKVVAGYESIHGEINVSHTEVTIDV